MHRFVLFCSFFTTTVVATLAAVQADEPTPYYVADTRSPADAGSPSNPVNLSEAGAYEFGQYHHCDACCESNYWQQRRGYADKHAPAGIMGDHVHHAGEVMVEYKYMTMFMDGNRLGTRRLTDQQALTLGPTLGTNVAATPTDMRMQMHMIHAMYGVTDEVTAYMMFMFHDIDMDHLRNTPFPPNAALNGLPFRTRNTGFGDIVMGALWKIWETDQDEMILNLGWSVPTGRIDNTTSGPTAGAVSQEFPYPMRLGSGSFNLRPGITYKRYEEFGSFGMQLQTNLPISKNWEEYAVSDEFRLSTWYSHLITDDFSMSFRVENLWQTTYDGADPQLNGALISTNRPDMRGGYWLNFGYGAALLVDGHLFNVEIVQPIYQDVNGIQLENDWQLATSWSKAF